MTGFERNQQNRNENSQPYGADSNPEILCIQKIKGALEALDVGQELRLNDSLETQVKRDQVPLVTFHRLANGNFAVYSGAPSKNGTYAGHRADNLQPIEGTVIARDGDIIQIGETEIKLAGSRDDGNWPVFYSRLELLEIGQTVILGRHIDSTEHTVLHIDNADAKISRLHCTLKKIAENSTVAGDASCVYELSDGLRSNTPIYVDSTEGWQTVAARVELGHGRKLKLPFGPDNFIELTMPAPLVKQNQLDILKYTILTDIQQDSGPQLSIASISESVLAKIPIQDRQTVLSILSLADQAILALKNNQITEALEILTDSANWEKFGYQYSQVAIGNEQYGYLNEASLQYSYKTVIARSVLMLKAISLCVGEPKLTAGRAPDLEEAVNLRQFSKNCALHYTELLLQAAQNCLDGTFSKRFRLAATLPSEFFNPDKKDLRAIDRASYLAEKGLPLSSLFLDPKSYEKTPGPRQTALIALRNYCSDAERHLIDQAFHKLSTEQTIIIGLGQQGNSPFGKQIRVSLSPAADGLEQAVSKSRLQLIRSQLASDHVAIKEERPGYYDVYQPIKAKKFAVSYRDTRGVWQALAEKGASFPAGTAIRLGSSFEFLLGPQNSQH